MLATILTVFAAGLLGGGIAADITVIVVVAAVVLVAIGIYNGFRNLVYVLRLTPRLARPASRACCSAAASPVSLRARACP